MIPTKDVFVANMLNQMRALAFANGYEGVTHAGIAIVAEDTGQVLLAQRTMDESDAPDVRETWEFPGGGLNPDEEPFPGAVRELLEETYLALPEGMVINGWRSANGVYQGFVYAIPTAFSLDRWTPTSEVQAVGWFDREMIEENENIRPEVRDQTDWDMIFGVSGNPADEEDTMTAAAAETEPDEMLDEPDLVAEDIERPVLKVHGVLAPENAESGDARGFNDGAVTARPYRLPFAWQKVSIGGHDGSVVVGSVDRLMRKDGLIHWEGTLMHTEEADAFTELVAFFGKFGVSVDGDRGSLDTEKTEVNAKGQVVGVTWFDAVRAAGLTAVAIPAFAEAYVALGPHPDMPADESEEALVASGDLVTFDRGPGWVTNPRETKRLHDYWTKKGQPGYAKIGWGTPGDFTRAKKLIGEKIAKNSPEDMKYLNQIIAQWHHDALGYWPGDLGKPGNAPDTPENRRRAATHASSEETVEAGEDKPVWEVVLTSSAGVRALPPASYFDRHKDSGALVIEEPDENGIRRTYGYAGEWGVCHIGIDGRCVEVPEDANGNGYAEYHLGRVKTAEGYLNTGLITYKVEHRNAKRILTETAQQAHFDDISNAWAAVRLGEDDRGVWFSGVVLPHMNSRLDDLTLIEASGQVSGEWKYGALRTLLTVGVPGFPVMRASAEFNEVGEVIALAASAFNTGDCEPTPAERMQALAKIDAEVRFERMLALWAYETAV